MQVDFEELKNILIGTLEQLEALEKRVKDLETKLEAIQKIDLNDYYYIGN